MGNIVQPMMYITKAISASTNFFEMIDSEQIHVGGLREPEITARGDIELKDVTFAYPTRPDVKVLSRFNACFKSGKTTALVGPSGSGKSTVVALLERWYELSSMTERNTVGKEKDSTNPEAMAMGEVNLEGRNINTFDLRWWRSRIGLVQQEPFLFNDSIENNVAFGLIGTDWEDASPEEKFKLVKTACEEAFADEFISKLPKVSCFAVLLLLLGTYRLQGYATLVGEGGMKLSGGQRQRIAIARSIIRQPAILILDEATSSIDVQGEQIVQKALDRLAENRTTIMIAHRLSTIRKADHIIVLREGTKVEEGTHEHLLSLSDGLYSSLVRAQKLEEDETPPEALAELSETVRTITQERFNASPDDDTEDAPSYVKEGKKKGFLRTAGVFIYERRPQWLFYAFAILAAVICGGSFCFPQEYTTLLTISSCQCNPELVIRAIDPNIYVCRAAIGRCCQFLGSDVSNPGHCRKYSVLCAWLYDRYMLDLRWYGYSERVLPEYTEDADPILRPGTKLIQYHYVKTVQ